MNFFKKVFSLALLACGLLTFNACVDRDFDEPPSCVEAGLTATHTIAELKALYTGSLLTITEDIIVSGKVVADDESGNFFEQLVIQDATGGISVKINGSNLFNSYPIGRTVYLKCKGLILGDYNDLIQIGGAMDNSGSTPALDGIPVTLLETYLFKGCDFTTLAPTTVTLTQLNNTYQNKLVTIEGVEFDGASQGQTWANAVTLSSVNLTIEDCNGFSLIVRSSGYSSFASDVVPSGNGSITGIYSVFGADGQLLIRDLTDVNMNDTLCDGNIVIPPTGDPLTSLNEDFSSVTTNVDINFSGWTNYYVDGGRKWRGKIFESEAYAQATAYSTGSPVENMEAWLITPPLNMDVITNMSLNTSNAFWMHNGLSIWISTDYDGTNVTSATWQELDCTIAGQSAGNYNWVPSGDINLSAYNGTAYIGFKYVGNSTSQTTNYQIDDIVID